MYEAYSAFDAVLAGKSRQMRALEWGEIVARLDAARELRRAIPQVSSASFAPEAARRLARLQHGEGGVNPNALSNGKDAGRMTDPVATMRQPAS